MEIEFGNMTPTIAYQLREQGLKYNGQEVRCCEKLRDSITNLQFSGLLTKKQGDAMRKKLLTKIKNCIL